MSTIQAFSLGTSFVGDVAAFPDRAGFVASGQGWATFLRRVSAVETGGFMDFGRGTSSATHLGGLING